MAIRWTLGPLHPNTTSLSFVSLERSSGGELFVAVPTDSGKVLINTKSRKKNRTYEVVINAERFQGVRTLGH